MTIALWLRLARERLTASGSPDPGPDAGWLLQATLGIDRAQTHLRGGEEMSADALMLCEERLRRREAGEPVQYIVGESWFYGRRFLCDSRALIPRQDTETLCECALLRLGGDWAGDALDLCTGSGILGVTLALERPLARVTGADISADALALARENADALGAAVEWKQGDMFQALPDRAFDAILCNPPYLSAGDMAVLQRELLNEPYMALFGGDDGLRFYRRIACDAPAHMRPGGWLFLEIGSTQAASVTALLREGGTLSDIGVAADLNGLDRVVYARRP